MIPFLIHQYCDRQRSADRGTDYTVSWRRENANFEYRVWSDAAASELVAEHFGHVISERFENCRDPLQRFFFFGAALLLVHGGLYIGHGIEYLQPAEQLLNCEADVIGIVRGDHGSPLAEAEVLERGFLAARPRAPQLGRLLAGFANGTLSGDPAGAPSWYGALYAAGLEECEKRSIIWLSPVSVQRFVRAHSYPDDRTNLRQGANSKWAFCGDVLARPPVRWARLLFLGHPRCGSAALSAMLKCAGVRVEHERLGRDGAVTWWQTGRRLPETIWPAFARGARDQREIWLGGRIFHYLRDPRDAIPSIVLENEWKMRANPSFQLRRRKIRERFGIDIGELDPPTAAATSYALWNKLAEDLATDGTVLVERPELPNVLPGTIISKLRRANSSMRKFGTPKPEIDIPDSFRRSPREARLPLERYLSFYQDGVVGRPEQKN